MIKSDLLQQWHGMRIIALLTGLFLAVQAILHLDFLTGLLSIFFLFQAITNTGCFGGRSCAMPAQEANYSSQNEFTDRQD